MSSCYSLARDSASILDDLYCLGVNPNSYSKSERMKIKWQRNDLIDAVESLVLKRQSLIAQHKAMRNDMLSLSTLYHEKWNTVSEVSANHESYVNDLIEQLVTLKKSITELRQEISQIEGQIASEIASRNSSPENVDFSSFELKIPKLQEYDIYRMPPDAIRKWHTEVLNSQLKLSKLDPPSPNLHPAAVSIAEDVNMTARKGSMSSHKMRIKVNMLSEKACELEERVQLEEESLRNLRRIRISKENARTKHISTTKARIRAHLETMKEDITALNIKRQLLKQQNSASLAQHAALCQEIESLCTPVTTAETSEESSFEEEETEAEAETDSVALESLLVNQRIGLENDIRVTKEHIRKLRKSSKRRETKFRREIARLWRRETELRQEITNILENISQWR